ncbi:MAG: exonuclease domain-containing protein [Desulfuromonadales bacterium]
MKNNFGNSLSPAVKYWIFLTGIIAVIFTDIFGSFAATYLILSAEEQAIFEKLFDKLIPFPFIGSIILVAFICTMVSLLFRYYIIPVLRMAEQTRLITTANPDFRINVEGARELVMLANVINESAEAYQKLQRDVDGRIQQSNMALKEERNRLAALMSELPYGVVVCSKDGRIQLYNSLAQEMLKPANGNQDGGAIGLGRSIFGVLEKALLVHSLELMDHAFARNQLKPALGLMTELFGSRFIRVNMAPITTSEEDVRFISGFVLSLEDITGEINADSESDRLLQRMVDAVQSSLGKLHKGINIICDMPGTGDEACNMHRQAIVQVTNDLEEHLAMARKLYSEHRRAYGNRENVLADTLLKVIAKNLNDRFAMQAEAKVEKAVWLRIDSYAIVQAVTTLAGLLKAEYGVSAMSLQIKDNDGPLAMLALNWSDRVVLSSAIVNWQTSPLFMDSDGAADSPATIINEHDGSITLTGTDANYCNGISITLPTDLHEDTAGMQSLVSPRPISYEFDLFHQPGQDALGKVPLRKLTFVVFDTETTGLNPTQGDEIIQLGAVRIVNGRLLHNECIDMLVNPQRPVPKSSVKIHGIDPELLPSQPIITQVLPNFHAFAAGSVLVAHNAAFDMRFLQLKEDATGLSFDNPVLDTLLLSSVVHPNQDGHSLDAIAERFNITISGRHTALGDALITAEILLRLIPLLEAQGIHTLEEALRASIKSPFAKIKY